MWAVTRRSASRPLRAAIVSAIAPCSARLSGRMIVVPLASRESSTRQGRSAVTTESKTASRRGLPSRATIDWWKRRSAPITSKSAPPGTSARGARAGTIHGKALAAGALREGGEGLADRRDLCRSRLPAGAPGAALEPPPHLVDVDDLLGADGGDEGAAVRLVADQALLAQHLQRLAQGGTGDADRFGERDLAQLRPRGELTGDDVGAQQGGDLVDRR